MEYEQSKARNYWQKEKDFTPKFQGEFKVGAFFTYAGEQTKSAAQLYSAR